MRPKNNQQSDTPDSSQVTQVLFFDGVCNVCNATVDFLLRRPGLPEDLKFASLQSTFAPSGFLAPQSDSVLSTVILEETDASGLKKHYLMSEAMLRVLVSLGGAWTLIGVFYLVPRFLRDAVYRFFARNRYQWFGKRDSCRVPTAAEKSRFLS